MTTETDLNEIPPTLGLQDIANIVQLVNIAIERGGYVRSELRDAILVTDKVTAFLEHTVKTQEAAKAAQQGET
jgi:hypothetical protein